MIILVLRTDKPEAEIGIYKDTTRLVYETWLAHRELAETIHLKIRTLLESQGLSLSDLEGLVILHGPGSFTGLRIGITVANALAASLSLPIVGAASEAWVSDGIARLLAGENDTMVIPEYGALPNVSTPKK